MFAIGPVIVIWGGRLSGGLLFVSGTTQLWPMPPSFAQELHAMFLCVAAMVPLTIGEFIAFYLAMLKSVPRNGRGVARAATLQHHTFMVFRDGAASIGRVFRATVGGRRVAVRTR